MGNTLQDIIRTIEEGRLSEAFTSLEAYQPKSHEVEFTTYLQALTTYRLGDYTSSASKFDACITASSPIDWWLNFGILAREAELWEPLIRVANHLKGCRATGYEATVLMAEAARREERFDDAVALFQLEFKREPSDQRVSHGYANALRDAGRYASALDIFDEHLGQSTDPEVHWNKALTELALTPSCLAPLETRFQRTPPPFLEYNPTALPRVTVPSELQNARTLVISEQGFGDTLQFCRYLDALQQKCKELAWVVPKRLSRLLKLSFPQIRIITKAEVVESEWHNWISLMSCGSFDLATNSTPYLTAPNLSQLLQPYKGAILLNWSGSPTYVHDYWRSLTLEDLSPLYAPPVTTPLASIQHGLTKHQLMSIPSTVKALGHLIDQGEDGFCDTAALLAACEAFITTDTSVAHLAGALNVRTYLILGPVADWRWEASADTTPWYPSMSLHRWQSRQEIPSLLRSIREQITPK